MPDRRRVLTRITRLFLVLIFLAVSYILFDYSIDFRPSAVHSSYRFKLGVVVEDQPQWLRQDNLTILFIKRSASTIQNLNMQSALQDPASDHSVQPEYARNTMRSSHPAYFVSFAIGTDLHCPIELYDRKLLKEICGVALYDFAGRALIGKNRFQNLPVPDYNFSDNFKTLIINP